MVKCTADENSRCVHECYGDFCRAYYHHEEDRCFGTCDPNEAENFLPAQLAYQIGRSGWQSRSSVDLKNVTGKEIANTAMTAKVLAQIELDDPTTLNSITNVANSIFGLVTDSEMLFGIFNIGWHEKNVHSALLIIEEIIRDQTMLVPAE